MVNYWLIRAAEYGKLWGIWKEEKLISVGWDIGDLSDLNEDEIFRRVDNNPTFKQKTPYILKILEQFIGYNNRDEKMQEGDIAIIFGPSCIYGIGKIGEYVYRKDGISEEIKHTYCRKIDYFDIKPFNLNSLDKKYRQSGKFYFQLRPTMIKYNISDNDFKELLNDISKIEYSLPKGMEKFHLESLLEDFLVATWDNIEEFKNLLIYKSDKGRIGKQYPTKTGPIDILCVDKANNDFVVFELKKDKPTDRVIGQIKRYMGWVKEKLAKDGQNVRGIIIAFEKDEKLRYALKTISDVKLMTYSIKIQLKQH